MCDFTKTIPANNYSILVNETYLLPLITVINIDY